MPKLHPWATLLLISTSIAACDTRPTIVINEFMADNETTLADGATGEYWDWIELYNTSDELVVLDGLFLTDDLDWPTQQALSTQLSIAGGGYLVLWASQEAANDPTHMNFALAGDGEELGLFWTDTDSGNITMLDGLAYNAQEPDISMARDEDGTGGWALTQQSTPGASNQ